MIAKERIESKIDMEESTNRLKVHTLEAKVREFEEQVSRFATSVRCAVGMLVVVVTGSAITRSVLLELRVTRPQCLRQTYTNDDERAM